MDYNHLDIALLSFIPGLINLGIFIYSYFILPNSKLSVVFSMLVFSAIIWQIGEGFLKLTTDLEEAYRWYLVTKVGTLLLISSCLYFAIMFSKSLTDNNRSTLNFLIYFPSIIFCFGNILNPSKPNLIYNDSYGFVNITSSLFYTIELIYISIFGIITTYILFKNWATQKSEKAALIAIGFTVPFIQGFITEIIYPEVFKIEPIPLTTASITVFSIASIIALKKYNLLSFSPYKVTDSIINKMTDAILISDNKGIIKYVNPSLLKLLGYKKSELLEKEGYFLIADEISKSFVNKMVNKRLKGESDRYEVNLLKKNGEIINAIISSSPYFENKNVIGVVSIIHDVTNEKKQALNLTAAMITGEEKERNRLAYELHDGISQSIAGINMKLQSLKTTLIVKENEIILDDIIKSTKEAITEIRNISHNLYPVNDDETLCSAIEKLISRHNNIPLKFDLNIEGNKPTENNASITSNIYRVLQEFINNSIKYANANFISINVNYTPTAIEVEIKDDGVGFDINKVEEKNGIGLNNMQKRIEVIRGTFNLSSEKSKGTTLTISVPL